MQICNIVCSDTIFIFALYSFVFVFCWKKNSEFFCGFLTVDEIEVVHSSVFTQEDIEP